MLHCRYLAGFLFQCALKGLCTALWHCVFIDDVINNNDIYKEKRNEMKNLFNKYADDKSSERLAKYLKL